MDDRKSARSAWRSLSAAAILACLAGVAWQRVAQAQPYENFGPLSREAKNPNFLLEILGQDAFEPIQAIFKERLYDAVHAIQGTRHPQEKAFWIAMLKDPGTLDPRLQHTLKEAAIEALERYGSDPAAAQAIAGCLSDEQDNIVERAASALHVIRNPAALDQLIAFDQQKGHGRGEEEVLLAIASTLDPKATAYALDKLVSKKPFETPKKTYQLEQCYMPWWGKIGLELARRKEKRVLPILLAAARTVADRNNTVDDRGILALGVLGDKGATSVLCDIVTKRDFHTQYWAAQALALLGDPAALPALREAVDKVKDYPAAHTWVNRSAIGYAMAKLGDAQGERILEELERSDNRQAVMYGLMFHMKLRGLPYAKKIIELFRPYQNIEKNLGYPVEEIFYDMAELRDAESLRLLLEVSRWKQADRAPYYARAALVDLPPETFASVLAEGLRSGDWEDRNRCAWDLMRLPVDPFPRLADLLAHGDLEGRLLAVRFLGRFARDRYL